MSKTPIGYVACCHTHLQDGHEHSCKVFNTKEQALEWINRIAGYGYDQKTFELFKLGKEIPLESANIEEPQPPKITEGYSIKVHRASKGSTK